MNAWTEKFSFLSSFLSPTLSNRFAPFAAIQISDADMWPAVCAFCQMLPFWAYAPTLMFAPLCSFIVQ